ncbi:MAG: tRNA lysidine(34) synthetase TilS [Acidobacteriia bacterium]|nr:tRNA lysidine(34) synthetase TilS [Terriglobia bacterium]
MADLVEILFRSAAERLLPKSGTVLAAVSGGADSVALLHLLAHFAARRPIRIVVAHLDHALRRGSAADRRFVERLASGLGLACLADRRPVAGLRRRDESPEEAARRVRRAFLLEAAAEARAGRIATGHTLDDQAETVLMRLARGAGPAAIAGMAPEGPGPFVRPLLGVERADLRAWLRRRGLGHREDPSNLSLEYDRNRVRRRVLPVLAAALNPRAARHLVEAAERLREDARLLDALARRRLQRIVTLGASGRLSIDARALARTPAALAGRIARLALERAGADPRRIGTRHVEALLGLAGGGEDRRADLPSGLGARRRGPEVVLDRRTCPRR